MKTLESVKCGQSATVIRVESDSPLKRRIMDMGILKGVSVQVKRLAPLGDPMEISVRGYELSIRKEDAKNIIVE